MNKKIFKKLIPIVLIALYVAIYFAILLPYNKIWFYSKLPTYKLGDSNILLANVVLEVLLVLLYSLVVFIIKRKNPVKLWNQSKINIKVGVAAFIAGITCGLYTVCTFKLPYVLDKFPMYNELLVQFFGQGAFIVFALFCLSSSMFKEVMFRGLIFNELKNTFPVAIAVILQAAIYGAANFYTQGIEAVVFAAFGALIFALIYLWTKSLWTSFLTQLGNIITICTLTMQKDNIISKSNSGYILIPSVLLLLVLIFYIWHSNKNSNKAVGDKELNVNVN